jgi:hypothetical protein
MMHLKAEERLAKANKIREALNSLSPTTKAAIDALLKKK